MDKLICGIHHAAIRCEDEAMYQAVLAFYIDTLGISMLRQWGEGTGSACMLDTGSGLLEIFASGRVSGSTGSVNHFAFRVKDTDACIKAVKAAGCRVTMESKDIVIPSDPPLPARIAFCVGPAGEEIEFFCEK